MGINFEKRLADFLEEDLGEWMTELARTNALYIRNLKERDNIIQSIENNGIKSRLMELNAEIQEAESHYLFLAGMKTLVKAAGSITSEGFTNCFLGINDEVK